MSLDAATGPSTAVSSGVSFCSAITRATQSLSVTRGLGCLSANFPGISPMTSGRPPVGRGTGCALARRAGVLSVASRLLIDPQPGGGRSDADHEALGRGGHSGKPRDHAEERSDRIARFYAPYHTAISAHIDRALAQGVVPILLSVHSFTPVWKGRPRAWHAGVLWDKDPRLAFPLMRALAAILGYDRRQRTYHGRLRGDCLFRHGTSRGLPHAIIEVRQDLVSGRGGPVSMGQAARLYRGRDLVSQSRQ